MAVVIEVVSTEVREVLGVVHKKEIYHLKDHINKLIWQKLMKR